MYVLKLMEVGKRKKAIPSKSSPQQLVSACSYPALSPSVAKV